MIIGKDTEDDLLNKQEVEHVLKAVGKAYRAQNILPTDIEVIKALDLFRDMKLKMLIFDAIMNKSISMRWVADDWEFTQDTGDIEFPLKIKDL